MSGISAWWLRLYAWQQLALFALYVAGYWLLFWFHASRPGDPVDTAILLSIAVIYSVSCLVMTWGTGRWSLRALGILGTLSGDAVLYASLAVSNGGWYRPIPEEVTDLARAFFVAGGPLLLLGIIRYLVTHRRNGWDVEP